MPKHQRKNQRQKDINFSTRTGTKKREKKDYMKNKKLNQNIKIRNSSRGSLKAMKFSLEHGISADKGEMCNTIKKFSDCSVVYEFNKPDIKKHQKRILALAMVLNFYDIPYDVSKVIIGLCKNNIHIEGNIFKILPQPVIRICNNISEFEFVNKKELFNVMEKYNCNSTITKFLEDIFFRELCQKGWKFMQVLHMERVMYERYINYFGRLFQRERSVIRVIRYFP